MIRSLTSDPDELSHSSTEEEDCSPSAISQELCRRSTKHLTRKVKLSRPASPAPEELTESSTDDEDLTPEINHTARQSSAKPQTSKRLTRSSKRPIRHTDLDEPVEMSSTENEDCSPSAISQELCRRSTKHLTRKVKLSRPASPAPEELTESSTDDEDLTPEINNTARQSSAKPQTSKRLTRSSKRPIRHTDLVEPVEVSSTENEDEPPSPATSSAEGGADTAAGELNAPAQPECPVCLQACVHPARLPCGHVYCFLCLKGIAHTDRRCAMCRRPIPPDYMRQPELLEAQLPVSAEPKGADDDEFEWFYEGKNGWWKFEERLSQDLEEAHLKGLDSLETLICGSVYHIDLKGLVQYNKDCPSRKRRIKRELATNIVVKGVAGIR